MPRLSEYDDTQQKVYCATMQEISLSVCVGVCVGGWVGAVMVGLTCCTLIAQCATGVQPPPAPESNQSETEGLRSA